MAGLLAAGCSSGTTTTSASTVVTTTPPAATPTSAAPTHTATATVTQTERAPASTPAPTSTAAAAGPAPCATSQLRLKEGSGDGAAGTSYVSYSLTNAGTSSCTLFGYPGVSVLDAAGKIVQQAAVRQAGLVYSGAKTGLVTIAPGHAAQFVLAISDTDPNPACTGVRAGVALRVYPPNQKAAIIQRGNYQACALRVSPVFTR